MGLAVAGVLGGLVLLVLGAEWLVRGASRLARAAGISAVVVGLTVVAFGTSAPELAVSIGGALTGAGDVAVGNVVGSNIFNVLAVLGVAALFGRLVVHQRIVRLDVPLLLVVTALVWWLAADGRLGMLEGAVLLAGLAAYTVFSYVVSRSESAPVASEYDEAFGLDPAVARRRWPAAAGLVAIGLVALVVGAQLLVGGATQLAAGLGVPDIVIGLTLVAGGTSLPELVTSVVAVRRGELDIAVGNVVGSNLFNLLGVLGAATVAAGGLGIPREVVSGDLPVTVLTVLIALPVLASGLVVARWEGGLLLVGYAAYVAALVAAGVAHPAAGAAGRWLLVLLGLIAVVVLSAGLVGRRRRA